MKPRRLEKGLKSNIMDNKPSKSTPPKKNIAEILDATGWALFFIWIGIASFATVGWGIAFAGLGGLLLIAQLFRRYYALPISGSGLVFGIVFVIAGILQVLDVQIERTSMANWLLPAIFIATGIAIFVSMWVRKPT